MPLLRRKVNKAVLNLFKAKKANKSEYNIDGHGLGMIDFKGSMRQIAAKDKLKLEMQKRKKGLVGFTRRMVNPNAVKRFGQLRRAQLDVAKKEQGLKRKQPLFNPHPLLKGFNIGDRVTTTSKRGNVRIGQIVDADLQNLILKVGDQSLVLKLDKLSIVK
jgi:hypothetical protein